MMIISPGNSTYCARRILLLPNAALSDAISASIASYSCSVTNAKPGDLVGLGVGLKVGCGSVGAADGCGSVGATEDSAVGDGVG